MHTNTILPTSLGPRTTVFDTTIDTGKIDTFVDTMISTGKQRQSTYTCCVNVHMLVEAKKDPQLKQALQTSDINTPDGMPIAFCIKNFNKVQQDRVAGMDLVPLMLQKAEQEQARVFFFGDTNQVLDQLVEKAQKTYPALQIAGAYSPPFRKISEEEEAEMIDMINASEAHVIFVALGCPKQEKWMLKHKGKIHGSMIGIGNAFRTFLGIEKRAPDWMQNLSLEWMYRLAQNPKRLWKRYFYSNSIFLFMMFSQLFKSNPSPSPQSHTLT